MYVAVPCTASNQAVFHELGGCVYDGAMHAWEVPIMLLPSVVAIMDCTIDGAVITAYHALLRRMLADFAAAGCKVTATAGKLEISGGSTLMQECVRGHKNGVVAVIQQSTSKNNEIHQLGLFPPATKATVSKGDRLIFVGMQNAAKTAAKKAAVVRRKKFGY